MIKTDFYLLPSEDSMCIVHSSSESNVLIVLSQSDYNSATLDMLKRILHAVGVQYERDCTVLALPSNSFVHYYNVVNIQNVRHILAFGVPFSQIGLMVSCRLYRPMKFQSVWWLYAHPLMDYVREKQRGESQKRRALWHVLQKIFSLQGPVNKR